MTNADFATLYPQPTCLGADYGFTLEQRAKVRNGWGDPLFVIEELPEAFLTTMARSSQPDIP